MEVRQIEDTDIHSVCMTINTRLLDSVEASFLLSGILDKQGLLHQYTNARIKYWRRIGEVWVVGENKGMLAGHYGKDESAITAARLTLSIINNVFEILSKEDKTRLLSNLRNTAGAENMAWRKQKCKKQNYYYIDLIAIDHKLQGSGAFVNCLNPSFPE